jgi:hypothetical protein
MIYVLDNNVISNIFRNFSPDVFPDIWTPLSNSMKQGKIISIDEVYCEMENTWGNKVESGVWLKEHKKHFLKPTNEEGYYIREIFRSKKFREGIKEKSLRNGTPEADAMLVAKAKIIKGIIVTAEGEKENSEKIPNIATTFGVPYMNRDNFYKMLRNINDGKKEYEGVNICIKMLCPIPLEAYLKGDENIQVIR